MPLFEYQCENCSLKLERLERRGVAEPPYCPHCGNTMTRLISAPAFSLKGSGFYVNDYKGKP